MHNPLEIEIKIFHYQSINVEFMVNDEHGRDLLNNCVSCLKKRDMVFGAWPTHKLINSAGQKSLRKMSKLKLYHLRTSHIRGNKWHSWVHFVWILIRAYFFLSQWPKLLLCHASHFCQTLNMLSLWQIPHKSCTFLLDFLSDLINNNKLKHFPTLFGESFWPPRSE